MTTQKQTDVGTTEQLRNGTSKPSYLALLKVIFYKQLILLVRYPVNTAVRFLMMVVIFSLVFFGGKAVAGPAISNSLDGIIVGFFLFTLAYVAYAGLAFNVTRESQWGTLERLFMSPHGFNTVMVVKTVVNICMSFLWGGALLFVMMLTTGRWLSIDPLTVIPLSILTLASVAGIGFFLAGLALIYKRIESIFQLIQFAFIGLIAAPVHEYEILKFLPVSYGSHLVSRAMKNDVALWEFPIEDLTLLVVISSVYLIAGLYCFHRGQIKAREKGLMGQY